MNCWVQQVIRDTPSITILTPLKQTCLICSVRKQSQSSLVANIGTHSSSVGSNYVRFGEFNFRRTPNAYWIHLSLLNNSNHHQIRAQALPVGTTSPPAGQSVSSAGMPSTWPGGRPSNRWFSAPWRTEKHSRKHKNPWRISLQELTNGAARRRCRFFQGHHRASPSTSSSVCEADCVVFVSRRKLLEDIITLISNKQIITTVNAGWASAR